MTNNKIIYQDLCSTCERPITDSAIIGKGRYCLIREIKENWQGGCVYHGNEGKSIIKKEEIYTDCPQCTKETGSHKVIIWKLNNTRELDKFFNRK